MSKKNILEKLKVYLRPGSEELAELIKLIEDMKYVRDEMVVIQGLLSDLEFRENYHLENERLKLHMKIAEDMFPENMALVKETVELIGVRKREEPHGKRRTDRGTESNDSSMSP